MRHKRHKWVMVCCALLLVLTGCGNLASRIDNQYPLENVVPSQYGGSEARIYRAVNQTVPEVAGAIAKVQKPVTMSKEDPDKMFLVYQDEIITVMKDTEVPEDSLIEVADKTFVENNYSPGFFEGYLAASVLHNLFSFHGYGQYRGYIGPGGYTQYSGTLDPRTFRERTQHYGTGGSVRSGSVGTRGFRGGGPGEGK